ESKASTFELPPSARRAGSASAAGSRTAQMVASRYSPKVKRHPFVNCTVGHKRAPAQLASTASTPVGEASRETSPTFGSSTEQCSVVFCSHGLWHSEPCCPRPSTPQTLAPAPQ